jgi:cyanophycinase
MTKVISMRIALLLLCATFALPCLAQSAPAYKYFRVGNTTDAHVTPRAGYALMGGGEDLDEAFQWLCDHASGGDLLVLRATGTDAYNPYIQNLCHLNSVATIVIPNSAAANDPFVAQAIRKASAIFISGGDQSNYINFWMNSPVQTALNEAISRGVPIGGTSAGLAVLGEYAYSAQGDKPNDPNLDSKTALADARSPRVTLVRGFLHIPLLANAITDTHFARRDRMGRLLVFLAELNSHHNIRGIGIDERAAVLLAPDGLATVVGSGSGAYFIDPRSAFGSFAASFGPFTVQKVASGHTFNLKTWTGDANSYQLNVQNGVIHSTQPDGAIY